MTIKSTNLATIISFFVFVVVVVVVVRFIGGCRSGTDSSSNFIRSIRFLAGGGTDNHDCLTRKNNNYYNNKN